MLAGFFCLWSMRTSILTRLTKNYFETQGLEAPQFTITEFGSSRLTIESITLSHHHSELTVDRAELSFSLAELHSSNRIEELTILGASLSTEIASSSENASLNRTEIPALSDIANRLDLSNFGTLPFKRIQILDSNLKIRHKKSSTYIPFDADAIASGPHSLDLMVRTTGDHGSALLESSISTADRPSVTMTLHLEEPAALLDEHIPRWKNDLPELKEFTSGALDLQANLSQAEAGEPRLNLLLDLHHVHLHYEELSAAIPLLKIESSFSDFETIPIDLSFTPETFTRDTLSITPHKSIDLDLSIEKLSVFKLKSQNPITWSYDSNTIQASSSFELRYTPASDDSELTLHATSPQFIVSDNALAPFTLKATGNARKLSFQTSSLELTNASPAVIQNGSGTLDISETRNDPTKISFKGILQPAAFETHGGQLNLPPADFHIDTLIYETRVESKLTADSLFVEPPSSTTELTTLQGGLNLELNLKHDDSSEQVSGTAKIAASNFSIQSKEISGKGISAQAQINFEDLTSEHFEKLTGANEETLSAILAKTTTNLDWQANRLASADFTLEWIGGNIAHRHEEESIVVTSSFGAGIFESEFLRLDQAYIETQQRGSLFKLEGEAQLSALLDGANIQIDTKLKTDNPLNNLSLSGEYKLSPIQFTHSDLPGKFIPELSEITFSGNVQASGALAASLENADASLSLSVRQGAIAYPASQVNAHGLEADIELSSIALRDSGGLPSRIRIEEIDAGDLRSIRFESQFQLRNGELLDIDSATVALFGGEARLDSTRIPLDGSDFQGTIGLDSFDLEKLANDIEIFDGQMQGKVSGYLPFEMKGGRFELRRGDLTLPSGSPASLKYRTSGLLTSDDLPAAQSSFSERLLKFLKIDPDRAAEEALGDITLTKFDMELFPEDAPLTPIRIHLEGVAHSQLADIPVIISTEVHGSLSELYNFLIRINSL